MLGRALIVVVVVMAACGGQEPATQPEQPAPQPEDDPADVPAEPFTLTSSSFEDGEVIPDEHSCAGADVPPQLGWTGVPEDAVELVLFVHDPDAPGGDFVHWTVVGIDPASSSTGDGGPPAGSEEGLTHFGTTGYSGPCPPPGESHVYEFELAALVEPSGLGEGADPADVAAAVEGAPEVALLTGRYPAA
jgi:Raf kinase inhibitor-like YbhB/YbcL family protein